MIGTPAQRGAIVVAFDGLVVDTRAARGLALSEAVSAEFAPCAIEEAMPLLAGRSLEEAIEAALPTQVDATTRDLTVLRARRAYSGMVQQGIPLQPDAASWLRARALAGERIVLRADSARREVERLLQLSGLDELLAFVRCADDLPRAIGVASLPQSWRAIAGRLEALRVAPERCVAYECDVVGAACARSFASTVQLVEALKDTPADSSLR